MLQIAIVVLSAYIVYRVLKKLESSTSFKSKLSLPSNPQDPRWLQYHQILVEKNPYYRKLPESLRKIFLFRLTRFMNGKKFSFVDMPPSEEAIILISAVAVQISFGIEEFEMHFFRDIFVMRTNYHFGLSSQPYEGHVNRRGIYLSWNNFEKSFTDYTDGNNLGLHEMAHALTYVNFTAGVGIDNHFKKRFKHFSKVGKRIFFDMQNGSKNMLGDYAATNYHEFWAVSIENFFERPEMLKNELPDLYNELVLLLKQDPSTPNLLINSVVER